MSFEMLFEPAAPSVFQVSELTRALKGHIEGQFGSVKVEGEISNFRRNASSGHCYFTLKDDKASLRCALFRGRAQFLKFQPRDGMKVLIQGRLSLYEAAGDISLVVDRLQPLGAGDLALRFEELKKRLEREGLFDPKDKRELPYLPRRIGVVTSPTGAAIQDFLKVLHQRWPNQPVLIAPARVQGESAAAEICRGIHRLGAIPDVDVVVLARGGGSIEDLWCFNEEELVRAIRRCPVPVISAVGHETDFTLADFAADLRAPTPTAAAEMVVRVKADVLEGLLIAEGRMRRAMGRHIDVRRGRLEAQRHSLADPRRIIGDRRLQLDRLSSTLYNQVKDQLSQGRSQLRAQENRLAQAHPRRVINERRRQLERFSGAIHLHIRERLAHSRNQQRSTESRLSRANPQSRVAAEQEQLLRLHQRLQRSMTADLNREGRRLGELAGRLDALSPLKVLSRGYSLTWNKQGQLIRRSEGLGVGDEVRVQLSEGAFEAKVTGVES